MSYSIYDRLGLADAAANGFPAISTELERALGSLDDATAVKVLRCLDPLSVAEEGVSGRAVFGLLGYARYEEFLRAMVGKEGRPGLLLPHHFNEVEFAKSGAGRKAKDHLLTRDGLLIAAMASTSAFGKTSREWMLCVQKAFARLAAAHNGEALAAIRDSLAASEARAKELAASLARARSEPVALNEKHVPDTTDGNFRDNYDFKRLTYVFPYVLVGTLYGNGVRCANTFTGMIMAVTNVHVTMPSEEVSNIMAKTQLQRAIKERIRVWTGAAPAYSTEMTTRQLYTMCRNFLDYMEDRQAKDIPQATLDGTPLPDTSDPVEVRVWVEQMESVFPDITPLDMGRTVSMDEPLVDRGEHIAGQASLSLYIVRNKIARRRKVRKVASDAEVDVVVVTSSDDE